MDEKEGYIIEKCNYYCDKNTPVHITLNSKKFYNGVLVDINDHRIIFLDEMLGEVYILLEEVYDIEPRKERRTEK